jgi:hypothetical protein
MRRITAAVPKGRQNLDNKAFTFVALKGFDIATKSPDESLIRRMPPGGLRIQPFGSD